MKQIAIILLVLCVGTLLSLALPIGIVGQEPAPQPTPTPTPVQFNPEIILPKSDSETEPNAFLPNKLLYFTISDTTSPFPYADITDPAKQIKWTIIPSVPDSNFRVVDNSLAVVFTAPKAQNSSEIQTFTVIAAISAKTEVFLLQQQFVIGLPPPTPTPNPPDPQPQPPTPNPPNPPDPIDPNVIPAPISEPGLRVLILEEVDQRSTLPRSQINLLTSTTFRTFLNDITEDWRLFDEDANLANEKPLWKNAFKLHQANDPLPWLLISNGTTGRGWKGPLPKTEAEATQLIKQFVSPAQLGQ